MGDNLVAVRSVLRSILSAGAVLLANDAMAQSPPPGSLPAESVIRSILAERVDTYRQTLGIVVGAVEPQGRRIVAYGKLRNDDPREVDAETLFEIGSVTKVFTALLLADMVRRGETTVEDPLAKLLAPAKVPERGGRAIKLLDLATHTSGLPRLPTNFEPKELANPYANYTTDRLNAFLSTHVLSRDVGSQYEYSNLGYGLLGLALARRTGTSYEALVRSRIVDPLGMASTRITLSPEMAARLASPHDTELSRVSNWDLPESFAGAGALRSSGTDLLAFVAATLGYVDTPLAAAMGDMLKVRRPIAGSSNEIALGWHILPRPDGEIVWHNGQTGGYGAFVGYRAKPRTGVVVLCNASVDMAELGMHLLDAGVPLRQLRKEVAVDPKIFDGLVGRYELTPTFILTVTRDGEHLFAQATGQARYQIYPEGERAYFYRVVDAQITFEAGEDGRIAQLVLHQNGQHLPARRTEPR